MNSKHDEDDESMNWGISIKNSKKTENNIFKEFGFVIEALRKKIKGGLYIRTTSTKCADKRGVCIRERMEYLKVGRRFL